ncbi:DUF3846 domain-containing protein [Rhodococcus ruber]
MHTKAIRIDAHTGQATTVDVGPDILRGFYREIDCSFVDRVALGPRLDAWVDDEGAIIADATVNLVGSLIVRAYIPEYPPLCGHIVIVGHDGRGETVSLSDTEEALILAMADIALKRVEEARG